jgi:hypothetical protein
MLQLFMTTSRYVLSVCCETGADALQVVAQKYKKVLADSAIGYEQLLAKYEALEKTIATYAQAPERKEEPDDGEGYVLVLVNAHSHKVSFTPFYSNTELTLPYSSKPPC